MQENMPLPKISLNKSLAVDILRKGDINEVWQLLDSDTNIRENGEVALLCAAYKGDTKLGKFLLDRHIDLHTDDDFALLVAVSAGHKNMTKLLLDGGANIHARMDELLLVAVMNGHKEVVEVLLDAGADPHTKQGEELRLAEKNGHTEIAALLRERMASRDINDQLREAVIGGNKFQVEQLLDQGARFLERGGNSEALLFAAGCGHVPIVELLLDRGADIHTKRDQALINTATFGRADVAALLLERGADPQARGGEALRLALEYGHDDVAALLKKKMTAVGAASEPLAASAQDRLGIKPSGSYAADAAARDKSGAVER